MSRLRTFLKSIDSAFELLNNDTEFREKFNQLIRLAKSPLIKQLAGDAFNPEGVEQTLNGILNDKRISSTVKVIANLFDCYSVDRFVPVTSERELEDKAFKLSDEKMLYAGIYFNEDAKDNETIYKLRMNIDDTPVTAIVKNRFWFPGPEGSFPLDLRYHRGFAQIQHSLDTAIIKVKKHIQLRTSSGEAIDDVFANWDKDYEASTTTTKSPFPKVNFDDDGFEEFENDDSATSDGDTKVSVQLAGVKDEEDDGFGDFEDDSDEDLVTTETNNPKSSSTQTPRIVSTLPEITTTQGPDIPAPTNPPSTSTSTLIENETHDTTSSTTEGATIASTTIKSSISDDDDDFGDQIRRRKRQLGSLLERFFTGNDTKPVDIDDLKYFTKQFPYPKYNADE